MLSSHLFYLDDKKDNKDNFYLKILRDLARICDYAFWVNSYLPGQL